MGSALRSSQMGEGGRGTEGFADDWRGSVPLEYFPMMGARSVRDALRLWSLPAAGVAVLLLFVFSKDNRSWLPPISGTGKHPQRRSPLRDSKPAHRFETRSASRPSPERKPSLQTLKHLLISKEGRARRLAILKLGDVRQHEALLVLLKHLEEERSPDLLCQAVLAALRCARGIGSAAANDRLVTVFETSAQPEVRMTILSAFKMYPVRSDGKAIFTRLRAAARTDQEREKVSDLLTKSRKA